jgi:hypothetical protein
LQGCIGRRVGRRECREVSDAVDEAKYRSREAADQPVGAGRDGLEYRLHVRGRAGDHLQDVGGRGLPLQRFSGLVEQPRIFDGDHGLVGEALQKRKLFVSERHGPVAMHDENTNRLALAPQRRAGHRAGARGAGVGQSGPVRDRGVEMVQIGNVDLPVLAKHRAGQIARANPELRRRNL